MLSTLSSGLTPRIRPRHAHSGNWVTPASDALRPAAHSRASSSIRIPASRRSPSRITGIEQRLAFEALVRAHEPSGATAVVYADSDIAAMGEEVRGLRDMAEAPDTSPPRKVHYNQRAERLKGIIAKHGRSRTALQQGEPARFTGAQRLNACAPIRK